MDCRPISSCPVSNVPKQSRYTRMHCKHTHTNAHANHAYAWATCYAYADLNVRHIQWTFTQERKLYRKRRHVRGYNTSHAHTVVWECCKDDRQSQWGMAKFDHQPTLNPWTDRHQIWNTWLRRGHLPSQKIGVNPPRGFCPPHTWNIHPKPSNVYFFSQFFRRSTDALVGPIFTFNTLYDVVLRKVVHFGGKKIILEFNWFILKKSKNL